jgi:hypothetical protein
MNREDERRLEMKTNTKVRAGWGKDVAPVSPFDNHNETLVRVARRKAKTNLKSGDFKNPITSLTGQTIG